MEYQTNMNTSVKKNIQILDCTIRDGGILNNWEFTTEFVQELINMNINSSVDIVELGYIHHGKKDHPSEWANINISKLNEKINIPDNIIVAVLGDVGTFKIEDIPIAPNKNFLFRVASPLLNLDEALETLNQLAHKGYQTSLNIMKATYINTELWDGILEKIATYSTRLNYVYIADSFGSFYPSQIYSLIKKLRNYLPQSILIGFHGHNQLQLAFANALSAIQAGADIIDVSILGMGKGPGNVPSELLINYLYHENEEICIKYMTPILIFIDKYMIEMKNNYNWGYIPKYMVCGMLNATPRFGQYLRQKNLEELTSYISSVSPEQRAIVPAPNYKIAVYIPIKLNNVHCPDKNIRQLNNKPLCEYIFSTILLVKEKIPNIEIYVYCSDEKIISYIPPGIHFLKRPKSLDTNNTLFHDIGKSFKNTINADVYCLVHVTAPFLKAGSIETCINKVYKEGYDSATIVCKQQNFMWNNESPNYNIQQIPRTQDLTPFYLETSGCYVFTKELIDQNTRIGKDPAFITISNIEGLDIDTEDDFMLCENILESYTKKN